MKDLDLRSIRSDDAIEADVVEQEIVPERKLTRAEILEKARLARSMKKKIREEMGESTGNFKANLTYPDFWAKAFLQAMQIFQLRSPNTAQLNACEALADAALAIYKRKIKEISNN